MEVANEGLPDRPSGRRWTADPGAMPGEASQFLDVRRGDIRTAKAFLVERDTRPRTWEAMLKSGRSLGRFRSLRRAAAAAERAVKVRLAVKSRRSFDHGAIHEKGMRSEEKILQVMRRRKGFTMADAEPFVQKLRDLLGADEWSGVMNVEVVGGVRRRGSSTKDIDIAVWVNPQAIRVPMNSRYYGLVGMHNPRLDDRMRMSKWEEWLHSDEVKAVGMIEAVHRAMQEAGCTYMGSVGITDQFSCGGVPIDIFYEWTDATVPTSHMKPKVRSKVMRRVGPGPGWWREYKRHREAYYRGRGVR